MGEWAARARICRTIAVAREAAVVAVAVIAIKMAVDNQMDSQMVMDNLMDKNVEIVVRNSETIKSRRIKYRYKPFYSPPRFLNGWETSSLYNHIILN